MSAYFTLEDHAALKTGANPQATQDAAAKFAELHRTLHRRMRDRNWDLHPHWDKARMISTASTACRGDIEGLSLPYLRSKDQAALVERLMGRDYAHAANHTDSFRHPVIEMRITPEHFTVELIFNPASWWDQRNLIGKLSIDRHRHDLRTRMSRMESEFCFGFWDGCQLSEQHVTTRQLLRGTILEEWLSTFADGQDWLRIGVWYTPEHDALRTDTILNEMLNRMGALYQLYQFALWTSNNNFQNFYPKNAVVTTARDRNVY